MISGFIRRCARKALLLCLATPLCGFGFAAHNVSHACGSQTDCTVNSGTYRIFIPDHVIGDKKIPAIIYSHGLHRSAERTLGRKDFRDMAERLGIAIIATEAEGKARSWNVPNGVIRGEGRDDFVYYKEVIEDVFKRFPIDETRLVAAGFSLGASVVWYQACLEPDRYAGFLTISGTFWRPQPEKCKRPLGHVYHVHGTKDRTFPVTGRRVRGKHQGDIHDTFQILFRQDECSRERVKTVQISDLVCEIFQNCGGEPLRFCLHNGGHEVEAYYLESGFRDIAKAKGW